jgi:DNA modification methylase
MPAEVERVLDGALADMTFTDPPYNVDYGSSASRSLKNGAAGAVGWWR